MGADHLVTHSTKKKGAVRAPLDGVFAGLQGSLTAELSASRRSVHHSTSKGDSAEVCWLRFFQDYLPKKYDVAKAFVLDCRGMTSEQIDIVVFDRHHSPFLLNQNGARFVPAESVYAVIEVKQQLSPAYIRYTGKKAESVRTLIRTSAPIPHAGGIHPPRRQFDIIAGVVSLGCTWTKSFSSGAAVALSELARDQRVDLGCSLQYGAFEAVYRQATRPTVTASPAESSLLFFFLRLLSRLQGQATAPAIDYSEYARLSGTRTVEGQQGR